MGFRAFVFGVLVAALSAASVHAQSLDEMSRKLDAMQGELDRVRADQDSLRSANEDLRRENVELRGRLSESPLVLTPLEEQINALIEAPLVGTVVESDANPITISGHFRFRFGFTNNRDFGADFATASMEDDKGTFVDARMNLAFEFAFDEHVSARFEMMASGLFDNGNVDNRNSTGATGDVGDFGEIELYQGYVLIDKMFGLDQMGARIGRGEIALGRELHFGNNDFFGGQSFDALLWWWAEENWSLTTVFAKLDTNNTFLRSNHPYPGAGFGNGFDDDEAFAAWFTLKSIPDHVLDVYYFYWNGERGLTVGTLGNLVGAGFEVDAHVFGARIGGTFDVAAGLDWNLEAAYEFGGLSGPDVLGAGLNGDNVDVDGFVVEAEVGLTLNESNLFRLFMRFYFAEGAELSVDGAGNVSGDSGHVPLYPERHSHGSATDHTAMRARAGLLDIIPLTNVLTVQAGFTFNPAEDWTLGATVLYAWHDEDVITTDGTSDDGIGLEIDLFAEHRVSAQTTIGGGFGIFLPSDGAPLAPSPAASPVLEAFAGDNEDSPAYLFYLQARVDF